MREVSAGGLARVVTYFAVVIALTLLCVGDGGPEGGMQGVAAQTLERPNIVFVLTDDQFPGSEEHMPNLNTEIVRQGVEFENMTSTFPLCCPGRATIQRGQYVHNTKIYGNSPPAGGWEKFKRLGLHRSTVATWLNPESGGTPNYETGLFGKYMNNYREGGAAPPGWNRWYAWNGVDMGWRSVNDQGNERPLDRQEADSLVADRALGFLDTRLDDPAPVFAFVNFGAMHEPYHHAQLDADKFRGVGVPRTPAFNEKDVSDKADFVRGLPRLSASKVSALDQGYRNGLRSLMRVDRFVGNAFDLLRRKGELGNTYFLYYTDNGSHFGQHRFEHGKLQPYEEDVNFPLYVRGPGIPRGVVKPDLVGNHDIAPTLADMGDATVPPFVDGRSFLPLATGAAASWPRTAILSEREVDAEPPNRWDMLRMRGKIYTRHEGGVVDKEYYDLSVDPYQIHNALGPSDTTYPPPAPGTLDYYERRLDDLYGCGPEPEDSMTCRQAENAPLSP